MWVIDGLVTVFLAVCSAAVAEGIIWLMMYRSERYIKLNHEIEERSNRLMRLRESGNPDNERELQKIISRKEERLLTINIKEEITILARPSSVAGIAVIVLLVIYNKLSGGKVAAKIPFLPSWIQGETYHNLPENGYYDLAYVLLYLLCMLWVRCNIQKWLGFAPSKAAATGRIGAVTTIITEITRSIL